MGNLGTDFVCKMAYFNSYNPYILSVLSIFDA